VAKAKEMTNIEVQKFASTVGAIGKDTIRAIAVAGPEMQVKLLQSLGLQSTLITDGKTPINLFNTALGFLGSSIGGGGSGPSAMSGVSVPKYPRTEIEEEDS